MTEPLTTEYRWGILRTIPDWTVRTLPSQSHGPNNPLARWLMATEVWRALTRPQRELLLSTVAGFPIKARADVTRRLIDRGLLVADPIFPEDPAAASDAGRFVVRWRTLL